MNTNLTEFEKKIRINETWFTSEGLEMLYDFNGQERFETLGAAGAANTLELHGIICESWQYPGNPLMIKWISGYSDEYDDNEGNKAIVQTASWEIFIQSFDLSQIEAIKIAAGIERARMLNEAVKSAQEVNRKRYTAMVENHTHIIIPETIS